MFRKRLDVGFDDSDTSGIALCQRLNNRQVPGFPKSSTSALSLPQAGDIDFFMGVSLDILTSCLIHLSLPNPPSCRLPHGRCGSATALHRRLFHNKPANYGQQCPPSGTWLRRSTRGGPIGQSQPVPDVMPSLSQITESSLAKAILTSRKLFR